MMVFTPLNEEMFDRSQVEMGYCKMFKHILEDFVTRKDAIEMMKPNNLPTNTSVFVPVTGNAGPVAVVGTAQGPSNGQVLPVYNAAAPSPASIAMKSEKEAIRRTGGAAITAIAKGLS